MGKIEDYRDNLNSELAELGEQKALIRQQRLDSVMESMADILELPEFSGDSDEVLIHHFGEAAFDEETYEAYSSFLARFDDIDSSNPLPVLFKTIDRDQWSNPIADETSITMIDPTQPLLTSKIERIENQKMHIMTAETAGVTKRELLLNGDTTRIWGNIFSDEVWQERKRRDFMPLSKSIIADDGRGGGIPGGYAFNDSGFDLLYTHDGDKDILVGWSEIENAILDSNALTFGTDKTSQLGKLLRLVDPKAIELMPRIKNTIDAADAYIATLERG